MTSFSLKRAFFALLMLLGLASASYGDVKGHLFLCFRATAGEGASTDYLVDLGLATQFTEATASIPTVALGGDILADLDSIYGTNWKTRGDVFWSVSGVQRQVGNGFPAATMFATKKEETVGTQSTPWPRASLFNTTPAGKMETMSSRYALGTVSDGGGAQTISSNNPLALIQSNTIPVSYTAFQPGGVATTGLTAFAYFDTPLGIENTFASGTANSVLDLYELLPGAGPSSFLGSFKLSDTGTLSFAVPAKVAFSAASYSLPEDQGTVHLTLTRTGDTSTSFTVNVSTVDGANATAGVDFNGFTDTPVTFNASDVSKPVDVVLLNRPNYQGDRSFTVTMTVASGNPSLIAPSTATVNIGETSPPPPTYSFSPINYSATEGDGTATLTIHRSPGNGATSIEITTHDGTGAGGAIAGTDYTAATGQVVNFADTETSKTVAVTILDPATYTGDRTFTVTLGNPNPNDGIIGAANTATVTIHDNDQNPAGTVEFGNAAFTTSIPNAAVVRLNRTGSVPGTTGSVVVSLGGGTIGASQLGLTFPVTVNFADGDTFKDLSIPLGATITTGNFNLSVGTPTNVSLGQQTTTTVTVQASQTPDTIKPKIKLTSPKAGKANATFDIAGDVTEQDPLDHVQYTLNGGAPVNLTLGALTNGVTHFSATGIAAENGLNTLTIQAFDNKTTASLITKVTFTYTNTTLNLDGTYSGLVVPTNQPAAGGDKNNASGLLTVTVGKTGTFSGKLLIGGASFSVGGVLQNNGQARFKPALGNTLAIVKKLKPTPLALGNLAFTVAADGATLRKLTGTLGIVGTIDAPKAFYDGKTNLLDPTILANKGKYTGVFQSLEQIPVTDHTSYPQGDGVGNVTIAKTGKFAVTGILADGTKVSMSGALSKNNHVALYAPLYTKKAGSIAGVVTLDNTDPDTDMESAGFLWVRPIQPKAKQYVNGWEDGLTVGFLGAAYVLPPKGTVQSVFPFNPAGSGNVRLTFADGKLTGPVQHEAGISDKNKVTNNPATDKDFSLSISSASGSAKGTFKHTDGTKTAFNAIIYQKGGLKGAYGYFLSNQPKNGPAGEGGGVTILQH